MYLRQNHVEAGSSCSQLATFLKYYIPFILKYYIYYECISDLKKY